MLLGAKYHKMPCYGGASITSFPKFFPSVVLALIEMDPLH
uniref:Uncharacterized protein n=1 Tax=Arundo donax TaxID=35708 RepID=A0A0A9APE1_ARUDO